MLTDIVADVMYQSPNRLDHPQAIGGLNPRSLQSVIVDRIFIGNEVQFRGVLHYLDADVAGVLVREQGVQVIDGAGENAPK